MSDYFKEYIEEYFGNFIKDNNLRMTNYHYEAGSFGDGEIEFNDPNDIGIKMIRDRSQWYIEFKKISANSEWIDFLIILGFEDKKYLGERNKIYSDFEIKERDHISIVKNILVNNAKKIVAILKDQYKYQLFYSFYKKLIKSS
jgi:hypothetical protein